MFWKHNVLTWTNSNVLKLNNVFNKNDLLVLSMHGPHSKHVFLLMCAWYTGWQRCFNVLHQVSYYWKHGLWGFEDVLMMFSLWCDVLNCRPYLSNMTLDAQTSHISMVHVSSSIWMIHGIFMLFPFSLNVSCY